MKTIKQISVFMENRQGQLAEILEVISKEGINLRALNVAETSDYGVLRLVADDPDKAVEALSREGIIATTNTVAAVWVPDRPGGLCELIQTLADDGINIGYMYSVFGNEEGRAYMIMDVDDTEKLKESLVRRGDE